jgi:hypothetical protein
MNFSDMATSIVKDLIKIQLQMMENQLMKGVSEAGGWTKWLQGLSGAASAGSSVSLESASTTAVSAIGGMMAQGGPVTAHKTYLVGERGPELFTPALSGGSSIPLSFGGARASGGPVDHHRAYLVGERGPEIFRAHESGTIIPNHMISTSNAWSSSAHTSVSNISNFAGMRADGGPVKRDSVYVVGERGPELYLPSPSKAQAAGPVTSRPAAPHVNVVINNNTGQKIEQDQSDMKFDGDAYHMAISLKVMKGNEKYRRSMQQMINGR